MVDLSWDLIILVQSYKVILKFKSFLKEKLEFLSCAVTLSSDQNKFFMLVTEKPTYPACNFLI